MDGARSAEPLPLRSLLAATAAVVAVVLVPAASATSSARVRLALIPLPKSSLGSAARGLKLADDSGPSFAVEAHWAHQVFGVVPHTVGRLGSYALDYGNAASGRLGVDCVWTSVDEYKNAKDAKSGLNFWQATDALLPVLFNHGGLSVTNLPVKMPAVGSARFGVLTSYSASNIAPVSMLDEVLTDGRYLLHVNVAARTAAQAQALAPKLAKKLDARLQLWLEGRLHAKPVRLPREREAGPPAGGPDLSSMALATTDLTAPATLGYEQYELSDVSRPWGTQPDFKAISTYVAALGSASGPISVLYQDIEWFSTENEANFYADRFFAFEDWPSGAVVFDLSSLGDSARGVVPNDSRFPGEAFVIFSTGRLVEVLQVSSAPAPPQVSDITSVAQTAADKINAAYSG
jgi:hypothetical protein